MNSVAAPYNRSGTGQGAATEFIFAYTRDLKLLRTPVVRLADRIAPSLQSCSALEHEHRPRIVLLGCIAADAKNANVLEYEGLVWVFDVDVKIRYALDLMAQDPAILLISAEARTVVVDSGQDQCGQCFLGDVSDVHLNMGFLNRGGPPVLDPALSMFSTEAPRSTLGVLMMRMPTANASAVIATRVKCRSDAIATKTFGGRVHWAEVEDNKLRLNVVAGSQAFGMTVLAVTKTPLAFTTEISRLSLHNGIAPGTKASLQTLLLKEDG